MKMFSRNDTRYSYRLLESISISLSELTYIFLQVVVGYPFTFRQLARNIVTLKGIPLQFTRK